MSDDVLASTYLIFKLLSRGENNKLDKLKNLKK